MKQTVFRKFFVSIILPSILAILLFIMSIFLIIIPVFEKGMMERKKEMISELTHTAWSLIEVSHFDVMLWDGEIETCIWSLASWLSIRACPFEIVELVKS